MAIKIFFGNYKGGVGKTTSVFQVGINMAQNHNKNVLLLDLDPQASLSKICFKLNVETLDNTSLDSIKVEYTLNYLLELYMLMFRRYSKIDVLSSLNSNTFETPKLPIFQKKFKSTGSLSFIPTRMNITNGRINDIAEQVSRYSTGIVGIAKLIEDIEKNQKFDYILIDCPPSINPIIQSIFLKSNYYIIPTIADDISVSGVIDYVKVIEKTVLKYTYDSSIGGILFEKLFSKAPTLIGILETMTDMRSENKRNSMLENLNEQLLVNNINILDSSKPFLRKHSPIRNYILESKIRHLSSSTNQATSGIPQKTINAKLHTEYDNITDNIISICENNVKH